ncbi:MAG: GatB/YqeY domain-containing protein [Desulfovibrionaceae bacterium]|nr:GatB/YqeY domain-containing protein [Desulfovibrionaceae bacterium]
MSLIQRINTDYINAYKARDNLRLGVLRHLKTAATNLSVELKRDVNDDELLAVVQKQAKQRADSIEQFRAGGREDLAAREEAELSVLREYLPEMLEGDALAAAVDAAVAKTGASGPRDMGKVMASLMADYKGRLDGKAVSALVKQRLS